MPQQQTGQHGKPVDKQADKKFGGVARGKKQEKTSLNGDAESGRFEENSYETKG
ncbi:MAG: hypothetical protein HY018_06110 [Hydrogenophilales bacterium]|nr:hypothetical protein [Hydrogenophilales bacterium]